MVRDSISFRCLVVFFLICISIVGLAQGQVVRDPLAFGVEVLRESSDEIKLLVKNAPADRRVFIYRKSELANLNWGAPAATLTAEQLAAEQNLVGLQKKPGLANEFFIAVQEPNIILPRTIRVNGGPFQIQFPDLAGRTDVQIAIIWRRPAGQEEVRRSGTQTPAVLWQAGNSFQFDPTGLGEGTRQLQVWIRTNGGIICTEVTVHIEAQGPEIYLEEPAVRDVVTSKWLQLVASSDQELTEIQYRVLNESARASERAGEVIQWNDCAPTERVRAPRTHALQRYRFACSDIPLEPGLNEVEVTVANTHDQRTSKSFTVNYDLSRITEPPVVEFVTLRNFSKLMIGSNIIRGWVSDPDAEITIENTANRADGGANNIAHAVVDRTGNFWVEDLGVYSGDQTLVVRAINQNALVTEQRYSVTGVDLRVSMNPFEIVQTETNLPLPDKISLSGSLRSGSGLPPMAVRINGVMAQVTGGAWSATDVPVTPGGVAEFSIQVFPASQLPTTQMPRVPLTATPVLHAIAVQVLQKQVANTPDPDSIDAWLFKDKPPETFIESYESETLKSDEWDPKAEFGLQEVITMKDLYKAEEKAAEGEKPEDLLRSVSRSVLKAYNYTAPGEIVETVTGSKRFDNPKLRVCRSRNILNEDDISLTEKSDKQSWGNWTSMPYPNPRSTVFEVYESCSIPEFSVPLPIDGRDPEEWPQVLHSRFAQTSLRFRTNGRAIPGQIVLLRARVRALTFRDQQEAQNSLVGGGTFALAARMDVPYSKLSAFGKIPGNNGIIYASLPSGDYDATVVANETVANETPGWYQFSFTGTLHRAFVAANGVRLRSDKVVPNAKFVVGERIDFAPEFEPPLGPLEVSVEQHNWLIGTDWINKHYVPDVPMPTGSKIFPSEKFERDPDLLRQKNTSVWFTTGHFDWENSAAKKNVSNKIRMLMSNGRPLSFRIAGQLAVHRPLARVHRGTVSRYDVTSYLGGATIAVHGDFLPMVATKVSGECGVTQLINAEYSGFPDTDGFELDDHNVFYHGAEPVEPSRGSRGNWREQPCAALFDSPQNGSSMGYNIHIKADFKDYVRFRPRKSDAIYVTLGTTTWGFNVTLLNLVNGTSTYSNDTTLPYGFTPLLAVNDFPEFDRWFEPRWVGLPH